MLTWTEKKRYYIYFLFEQIMLPNVILEEIALIADYDVNVE